MSTGRGGKSRIHEASGAAAANGTNTLPTEIGYAVQNSWIPEDRSIMP